MKYKTFTIYISLLLSAIIAIMETPEQDNSESVEIYVKNMNENGEFIFDMHDGEQIYVCRHCGKNYTEYLDPFIVIYDASVQPNPKAITYEYCLTCLDNVFQRCFACKRELDEPWEPVYVIEPENKSSRLFYCTCCWNDPRNKYYKDCCNGRCEYCKPIIAERERKWQEYQKKQSQGGLPRFKAKGKHRPSKKIKGEDEVEHKVEHEIEYEINNEDIIEDKV